MMENSYKYQIPRYLDEPFRLILWTMDELLIVTLPFLFFSLYLSDFFTGIITSAILLLALKKLKGNQGHRILYAMSYWYLPTIIHFKATPPSYQREYIG